MLKQVLLCLTIGLSLLRIGHSQDDFDSKASEPKGFLNWETKTLGGGQFWTDVRCVGGWKIQRNATTDHHRLISADNTRMAWGNFAHCQQKLNRQIADGIVKPATGKIVILLHGLGRSNNSMSEMAHYLQQEGKYSAIKFEYASTRETVDVHANDLRHVINGLSNEVTEINFVCHSLGNIVVRHYLEDTIRLGEVRDPRIARMVMLGPPNQGSRMAEVMKNSFLFKTFAGASGAQLSNGWQQLESRLGIPDFEFGIIAGGQTDEKDWDNFFLDGKDDFTVSLEEAKLAGARDLFVQPLLHSFMMNQPQVLESTLRFLQHGYFVSDAERQPIPVDWTPQK